MRKVVSIQECSVSGAACPFSYILLSDALDKSRVPMALVIRMKNVSRTLIFIGSFLVWAIVLLLVKDAFFNFDEYVLLLFAGVIGVVQTWVLAMVLGT